MYGGWVGGGDVGWKEGRGMGMGSGVEREEGEESEGEEGGF